MFPPFSAIPFHGILKAVKDPIPIFIFPETPHAP